MAARKKTDPVRRYVLCPANGYRHEIAAAVLVRYGPKGCPNALCPHCRTRVFLPKDDWKATDGLTRAEAEELGCLVTQL